MSVMKITLGLLAAIFVAFLVATVTANLRLAVVLGGAIFAVYLLALYVERVVERLAGPQQRAGGRVERGDHIDARTATRQDGDTLKHTDEQDEQ